MGQDKGQAGTDVESGDPERIKEEIEQTREELGDTVAAVTEKADVKKQAKAKVSSAKREASARKDAVKQKAAEATSKVSDVTPESAGAGIATTQRVARENPVPLALGVAVAGGFVLGWLVGRR
jgi:ElaB/YqjD/DUF883 family membrane-anchored ribosome-binding protein